MILLQPDCLVFKTANGENIPCSAQEVTVELIGSSAEHMDDAVIKNAAEAVLHYFKKEVGTNMVSIGEFSRALERVLRGLGYQVHSADAEDAEAEFEAPSPSQSHCGPTGQSKGSKPAAGSPAAPLCDLRHLATEAGDSYELIFFPRLRQELRRQIRRSPRLVRFFGLRDCVKQLAQSPRWTRRCRGLEEQIVEYLRTCLLAEPASGACGLVIH